MHTVDSKILPSGINCSLNSFCINYSMQLIFTFIPEQFTLKSD